MKGCSTVSRAPSAVNDRIFDKSNTKEGTYAHAKGTLCLYGQHLPLAHGGGDAEEGSTLSPNSAQALKEAKISVLKSFRPRQLTEKMVKESLLVVCMTERHREKLSRYPNVTSFFELCGREIPDPYGLDIDAYRVTLRRIRECIPRVIEVIEQLSPPAPNAAAKKNK